MIRRTPRGSSVQKGPKYRKLVLYKRPMSRERKGEEGGKTRPMEDDDQEARGRKRFLRSPEVSSNLREGYTRTPWAINYGS